MLYQAIYVAPGSSPPAPEIVRRPELARYVEDWGRPGDLGVVAEGVGDAKTRTSFMQKLEPPLTVGAAWLREFSADSPGYGWVGPGVPELSIALLPEWRGRGIGSRLLIRLLEMAKEMGITAISLSVSEGNPARRLYERAGFRVIKVAGDSLTMLWKSEII